MRKSQKAPIRLAAWRLCLTGAWARRLTAAALLLLLISAIGRGAPAPHIGAVVNGANFGQAVSGGSIASLFGENLASSLQVAGGAPYPTILGDTSLIVGGYAAPLFAVSPTQINFQLPWEVLGQSQTTIQLTVGGVSTSAIVTLNAFSPGLFTTNSQGTGQGAVLIAGTASIAAPNGAFPGSRPVHPGEYLEIYGTGMGPVNCVMAVPYCGPADGEGALSNPSPMTLANPEVTLGGVRAKVSFKGLAPGFAGLYQVNVQVPANTPSGDAVELQVSIPGEAVSNTVTVAVQAGGVSVAVMPSTASVQVGNTLTFAATVSGTSNSSVTWALDVPDPSHGWIDNQGNYQAPSELPLGGVAVVTATSTADPTKYASALVTITGVPGSPGITVTPQSATILTDGTLQFTANVTGTANTAVTWSTSAGVIDSTGLLSHPTGWGYGGDYPGQVTATLKQNPTISGVATFYPVEAAQLTGISPAVADVGQAVQLLGPNIDLSNTTVYFTGPNGVPISIYPNGHPFVVPVGATTGPVYMVVQTGEAALRSNSVLFTRQPHVLLHAPQNDLATGESVQIAARFLGASSPQSLDWTADNGTITAGGEYTAPAGLTADEFAHVTACLHATQSCDTAVLGLHPFRIQPTEPNVQMGAALQLNATSAGAPVAPAWSIDAGGGNLLSSGLFTAPTNIADSGGIPISAAYQGLTEQADVAVTNSFPGLIQRVYQYQQYSTTQLHGKYAQDLAIVGNRAYVVVSDLPLPSIQYEWWIDTYDISDPTRPVWLDSTESALPSHSLYADSQNQLLVQVDQDDIAPYYPPRLAVYDLGSGYPVLVNEVETPVFGAGTLDNGRFFAGVGAYGCQFSTCENSNTLQVYIFNTLTGTASTVPLPGIPSGGSVMVKGDRLYVSYYASSDTQPTTVAAYDISTEPFTLLGSVEGGTGLWDARMFGDLIIDNSAVIDTSNDQLRKIADLGGYGAVDMNPAGLLLAGAPYESRIDIIDMSTPSQPVHLGSLSPLIDSGVLHWVGNYILSAQGSGGLAASQGTPVGGPVPAGQVPLNGVVGVNAYAGNPPYLYSATVDENGNGVVQVSNFSSRSVLGTYTMPSDIPLLVQSAGNMLFVGSQKSLTILDVSNPSAPAKVGSLEMNIVSLAVAANVVFAGTGDSALTVVDVTRPSSPMVIAHLPLADVALTVRATGHLLAVADNTGGFLVADISSPLKPMILSRTQFSSPVMDVAIDGNLALLADGDGGLVILDLTNPTNPIILSQTPLEVFDTTETHGDLAPFAVEVVTNNRVAYLGSACSVGSVFGFDYSKPVNPRLVSLGGYGEYVLDPVGPLLFFGSDLLVADSIFDYSQPRNVIVQDLAPSGLRLPATSCLTLIQAERSAVTTNRASSRTSRAFRVPGRVAVGRSGPGQNRGRESSRWLSHVMALHDRRRAGAGAAGNR